MEALDLARAKAPHVPFVFVTGALGEERVIELLRQGAADYVLKDRLERLGPAVERAVRLARAEAARRESERSLATLLANLPGMAFRCAPGFPGGTLLVASEGARLVFGARDLVGRPWRDLVHADDLPALAREAEAAFAADAQLTATFRTPAGDRWVRVRCRAGADGAVDGFAMDATDLVLREVEARARVEFQHQLLGIVSHDLRNPLSAIVVGAQVLLRDPNLPEPQRRTAGRIQSSGERATRLIRDLLDFTQAQIGGGLPVDPADVDFEVLLRGVVDEIASARPDRHIALVASAPGQGRCDPDRITQAVGNLLHNALQYSHPGTPVTVRAVGAPAEVVVEVHNLGDPIPEAIRPRLFAPMQRGPSHAQSGGRNVGLGLYIVDQVARGHGGHVECRSSVEDGTTFVLRIPRGRPG